MGRSWIAKKCMRNKAAEEMKEGDRSRLGVQAVPPCHSQHKHPPRSSPRSLWHAAGSRRGRSHSAAHPWACTWPRAGQGWLSCSPRTPPGWRHPEGSPQHLLPTRTSAQAHAAARLHTCCPDASLQLVHPTRSPVPAVSPGSPLAPVQPQRAPSPTCTTHEKAAMWVRAPSRSPSCAFTWAQHCTWGPARSSMCAHAGRQLPFCSRAVQEGAPSRALATLRSWAAAKAEALGADLT